MKTFLLGCGKVLLVLVLAIVLVHLWPITVVPFAVGLLLVLGLGTILLIGLVTAGAVGVAAVAGVLATAITLLAVLSPVWIPVLVVAGIVWLVKKSGGPSRRTATPA